MVFNKTYDRVDLSLLFNSTAHSHSLQCGGNITDQGYYQQRLAFEILIKVGAPLLVICGTIGNFLLFLVMLRPSIRQSMTSHYLRVLAVADTAVLWIGYPRHWIWIMFEEDIRSYSNFGCKLHIFLVYWSCYFSAWVLVCVTLERLASVVCPLHARRSTSTPRQSTCLVIFPVGGATALICGHFFWSFSLVEINSIATLEHNQCTLEGPWKPFVTDVWIWVDLLIYCLVPFTIITCSNLLIVSKVRRLSRRTNSVHTHSLVIVSTVFLVTTSPYVIYNILIEKGLVNLHCWTADLIWALGTFMYFLNNSVNFLIYCLSSQRFRGEFLVLVHWRKPGLSSQHQPIGTTDWSMAMK